MLDPDSLIDHVSNLPACSPPPHRGTVNRRIDFEIAFGFERGTG
jgi:hypothetical protein